MPVGEATDVASHSLRVMQSRFVTSKLRWLAANADENFADMFDWQARAYLSTETGVLPPSLLPDPIRRGSKVGQVTCSMVEPPMATVRQHQLRSDRHQRRQLAAALFETVYRTAGAAPEATFSSATSGNDGQNQNAHRDQVAYGGGTAGI